MEQKKRFAWADFMRGWLMFLVILYHSEVYYSDGHTWSWIYEPFFLSGFFFVSGYLFTSDIFSVSIKSKLLQVLRGIIVPYLFFVTAFSVVKIILMRVDGTQALIDALTLRSSWFVITIGVMQIIYALALKIRKSISFLAVATLLMFIIGYALVLLYRKEPIWLISNPFLNSPELPNRLPLCINLALVQAPFFFLGMLYRRYDGRGIKIPMGIVGAMASIIFYILLYVYIDHNYVGSRMCVVVHVYNNILLMYLYAVIAIYGLVCISKVVQMWKPLNYIGKYSVLFYFLNGAVLTILSAVLRKIHFLDSNNYFNQILVAIIAVVVMFPCVWFINRYLPFLRGDKVFFNKISQKLGLPIRW